MATGPRLIVIGTGNMASAILRGATEAGVLAPEHVWVVDPDQGKRAAAAVFSTQQFATAADALLAEKRLDDGQASGAQILLAVKPQALAGVAAEIVKMGGMGGKPGRIVISILAGTPRRRVVEAFATGSDGGAVRCIRVMPNTPASIRRGISAIAVDPPGVGEAAPSQADLALARAIFTAVGEVIEIEESLMDAFTAVAGSGPAYLFRFVEALAHAAEGVGFEPAVAAHISRATVTGAAALLAASDQNAGDLRAAVTSKGGTTAAALASLEDGGLDQILAAAVRAARDRGEELARG